MTKKLILFLLILIYGCKNTNINDKEKRNENWIYWIDKKTGIAEWVPITENETTLKDGSYTRFYSKGEIYQKGKLKNGKEIDTIYFYDLKQRVIQYLLVRPDTLMHFYLNNGPYISYSQNGKIFEKGIIENNQIGDEWTKYFENGKIDWTKKLVKGTGWNSWYFPNGQISDSIYHLNGKTHGQIKIWFDNGQIKEISNWRNGLQNGIYQTFYENGKPNELTNWVNDKAEGKSESWYENGRRKSIKFFISDLNDGNLKQWYSNGKIQLDANFSLGQKNGKVIKYYENGNIQAEGFYKNDLQNGICTWYNEKGELTKKETYLNGQLVTEK